MSTPAAIRFAIAADGALEPWQLRCIEKLQGLENVHAVAVISARGGGPASFPGVAVISGTDAQAAEQLRSLDLDFILTWSPGASLIDAARQGLWRYQFGDWIRFRGEPAGFWEAHEGESVSAAMLVRVQRDPDSIVVLREGYLRTNLLSAEKNRRQLQERCMHWAAQLCSDIRNGVTDRLTAAPLRTTAVWRTAPSGFQLLIHRLRVGLRTARTAWRDLFRHEQWNVGIVEQPISDFLRASSRARTRWLPAPPPDEIRADPFGVWRENCLTVLCEHLSFDDNRGVIVALEPDSTGGATAVQIGPRPPVHLSYPFLMETDGRLLCIPETHEAKEIALYEPEHFPDRWTRTATLVPGTVTVDASLFRHGQWWWLAGSEVAPKGANSELHLWYATELTGPWLPHPGNPVKIDVRSARPGGTPFVVDGVLYRPAQDCSTTYGRRIVINRVVRLTPTCFHEETAASVDPEAAGPYPDGLHTLSAAGRVTLIDGKRTRFVPAQMRRTLQSWLGRRRAAHG